MAVENTAQNKIIGIESISGQKAMVFQKSHNKVIPIYTI